MSYNSRTATTSVRGVAGFNPSEFSIGTDGTIGLLKRGGYSLIQTASISTPINTVDIINIPTTYNELFGVFSGMEFSGLNNYNVKFSTDNLSTFQMIDSIVLYGTTPNSVTYNQDSIIFKLNSTLGTLVTHFHLYNFGSGATIRPIQAFTGTISGSGTTTAGNNCFSSGTIIGSSKINSLRITGVNQFTSGTFEIYGA